MEGGPLYISQQTIRDVLDYKSLIAAVEKCLGNFSRRIPGNIEQPVRTVFPIQDNEGFFASMPVYSKSDNVLATKLLTFCPKNEEIPTHNAIIVLFCSQTGVPKAILDGDVITARRTAAASAVATKYLAPPNPKCLAIAGSGIQARSHYDAITTLFDFDQVKIWNHRPEGAQRMAQEIGPKAKACTTLKEAVTDADVIVTVTSSRTPLLRAEWVKKGAHINAVGACRPTWQELYPEVLHSSVVYVDSREGAMAESGDIILSKAEVYAEIGEVVAGTKEAKAQETTLFKSLGMAIQDAVSARLVLERVQNSQPSTS